MTSCILSSTRQNQQQQQQQQQQIQVINMINTLICIILQKMKRNNEILNSDTIKSIYSRVIEGSREKRNVT